MEISFNGAKVQGKLTDLRVSSTPVYSEDRKTILCTVWRYELTLEETHETPLPALGVERADEPAVVGPEPELHIYLRDKGIMAAIGDARYCSGNVWEDDPKKCPFQTAVNEILIESERSRFVDDHGKCFFHVPLHLKEAFTSNREYVFCCAAAPDALDPAPKYDPETGLLWYFYGCRLVLDR